MERGRGRKPQSEKQLITARLKEGIVMFRRGIFRRFNKLFKADTALHKLIESDHPFWSTFREVLAWARSTETVYENKHQKNARKSKKAKADNDSPNILSSVAYKYSKKAMEAFFRNEQLNFLFRRYSGAIMEEGYVICVNRRDNRTDCQPISSSNRSTPIETGIAGHSVAYPITNNTAS